MESLENSPIALVIAQMVILILNSILYSRQKNAVDVEKRDRGAFGRDVSHALDLATDAKRGVEQIEMDHYKKLAALFASCCSELEVAKAKIRALEESLASLSNKVASRDRADRSADKRAAKAEADEDTPVMGQGAGALSPDILARLGAIPLAAQSPAAPEAQRRPHNFGRVVR